MSHPARLLKQQLESGPVLVPGVYDGLTAKLLMQAGHSAAYLTGAGISYSTLGTPDLGLVSFAEVLDRLYMLRQVINLPIIVDADTGFGGVLNVARTVKALETAGAAAVQIEDQVFPKRCGHLEGKEIVPIHQATSRIKAAVAVRNELIIIARTDALAVEGLDSAIDRARSYFAAGADIIFVESPRTVEEYRVIRNELQAPLVANMVEGGISPLLTLEELQHLNYEIILYPNTVTRVMARAAELVYITLKQTGCSKSLLDTMMLFPELNKKLGLDSYGEFEERFVAEGKR